MTAREGLGTPKHDALLALSKAVGDHYRATGDDGFTISVWPKGDATLIVRVRYEDDAQLAVLIPRPAVWSVETQAQLAHEFNTVLAERIKYEKFCEGFIDGKVKGVANAYR